MPRKPISFELDFMVKDIFPRFTVKQFDDVSFNIKPLIQGKDYDVTGMKANIYVGVANDMFLQNDGITVSKDNINVMLDKNMLQKKGRVFAEIELEDSAGTITSSSFIFDIDAKIGEGATIPGVFEGFVDKYERLVAEFKQQVKETIDTCNSNVDNALDRFDTASTNKLGEVDTFISNKDKVVSDKMVAVDNEMSSKMNDVDTFVSASNDNINNKIGELGSKVDSKIVEANNAIEGIKGQFNALAPTQSTNAEVQLARTDITGKTHASLQERLISDNKINGTLFAPVEGSNVSIDSVEGYLRNVQVLGNTVQNASNLADIKSVGDKVEGQNLYEIPLLSVGKNLNSGLRVGRYVSGGAYSESVGWICNKTPIKVIGGTTYTFSSSEYTGTYYTFQYNEKMELVAEVSSAKNITMHNNAKYVNFSTANNPSLTINTKIQIEEGTQAAPYEPYQEDKLTILSPVQLEKVGDVADRIVEKDGVWGVEKNVLNLILNGKQSLTSLYTKTNTIWFTVARSGFSELAKPNKDNNTMSNIISSKFIPKVPNLNYSTDEEGIAINANGELGISLNKSIASSLIDANTYFSSNNVVVKVELATPQFIPLSHSQQVKLRTFANKTNISFLTEIEGTIKADVPKSLGATVNVHTKEIDNIYTELDRVKKLEQSTVSTVVTDKDFEVVEQTSNGYFEDVELKGRTLVNRFGSAKKDYQLSTTLEGSKKITCINQCHSWWKYTPKEGDTLVFDVISNSYDNVFHIVYDSQSNIKLIQPRETGRIVVDLRSNQTGIRFSQKSNVEGTIVIDNIMIINKEDFELDEYDRYIEGGYFEGLSSVGDGTDEIVVSSVDENLFDIDNNLSSNGVLEDGVITNKTNSLKGVAYFNTIVGKQYTISFNFDTNSVPNGNLEYALSYADTYGVGENIKVGIGAKAGSITVSFIAKYNKVYLISGTTLGCKYWDINMYLGTTPKPYTPHKADKKKLLYFDPVDNTWKKPVLDEFSTVKKGSDGVYRYYKRGYYLPPITNISVSSGFSNTDYLCGYIVDANIKLSSNIINTIFSNVLTNPIANNTCNYVSSHKTDQRLYFSIKRSELQTQDANGIALYLNKLQLVCELATEKVYECTNIDLITYENETNFTVKSGVLSPKTTLKVHSNISNVVSLLQKKVSLLESNMTKYMITQNRMMLTSRYNADTVGFKVDVGAKYSSEEYDIDLYKLILNNVVVGTDNYDRFYVEEVLTFYWMDFRISDEMYYELMELIELQHNPPSEEAPVE